MEWILCGWCKRLPTPKHGVISDMEESPSQPGGRRGVMRRPAPKAEGGSGSGELEDERTTTSIHVDHTDWSERYPGAASRASKTPDHSVYGDRAQWAKAGDSRRNQPSLPDSEDKMRQAGFTAPPHSSLMGGVAPARRSAMAGLHQQQHQQQQQQQQQLSGPANRKGPGSTTSSGGSSKAGDHPHPPKSTSSTDSTKQANAEEEWFSLGAVRRSMKGSGAKAEAGGGSWLQPFSMPAMQGIMGAAGGGWHDMLSNLGVGQPMPSMEEATSSQETIPARPKARAEIEEPPRSAKAAGGTPSKRRPPVNIAEAQAHQNHGSNQLSNEEIEKLSCALEEMATAGVISHELEKKMCDKLAHCDTHLLMTWTVYQCNGNEKRFLQSIRDMP